VKREEGTCRQRSYGTDESAENMWNLVDSGGRLIDVQLNLTKKQ
jgi:hypothetical protein